MVLTGCAFVIFSPSNFETCIGKMIPEVSSSMKQWGIALANWRSPTRHRLRESDIAAQHPTSAAALVNPHPEAPRSQRPLVTADENLSTTLWLSQPLGLSVTLLSQKNTPWLSSLAYTIWLKSVSSLPLPNVSSQHVVYLNRLWICTTQSIAS